MRALILTITAGHGHNRTANSIAERLMQNGHYPLVLDAYEYINPVLKESFSRGYLLSTSISPQVYGRFYRLAEKKEKSDSKVTPLKITTTLLSKKILSFIREFNPDAIICTHVSAAQLVSDIRTDGLNVPTIGIITDYTVHPFWDETYLDYYVLASELLEYQAVSKGIPREKLLPFGIPIDPKFANKMDIVDARATLSLENKTTILIMGGSMGYGNAFKVIRDLCRLDFDFQIVSVCGGNKSMKRKIDKNTFPKKIVSYGFTEEISTLMDAADILITKPGGLTVSEAMAKELPMVLTSPIPGQEERNREFLLNHGAAMAQSSTLPIDEILGRILTNSGPVNNMRNAMRMLRKPFAVNKLVDFLENNVRP